MAKVENNEQNPTMDSSELIDNHRYQSNALYPTFGTQTVPTTISSSISVQPNTQQQQPMQTCVLQQTTATIYHRNGHSRNPSSINGITIAQVMQPSLNKPDTIDSILKLIRFRADFTDTSADCAKDAKNRQICGIREARLISKLNKQYFSFKSRTQQDPAKKF